ncbi:MAG: hypothetical protein HQK75_19815 [Candidatus Magnetomorum sp.]|nr:hypothetical protein [Candidatus Magnetomorum sp.]
MFSIKNALIGMICLLLAGNTAYAIQTMDISADVETITATHQAPLYYAPDQTLTIHTSIEWSCTLTALGMNVTLPTGWTYMGISGANPSDISPKQNENHVFFAWINNLESQLVTFSYSVKTTDQADQNQSISARMIYRVEASEEQDQLVSPHPLVIRPDIDSDGDGIINSQDAFPDDKTESLDSDQDGQGNNADPDDDNDNMPDAWELEHHLDALIYNPDDDPDNDGVSNIQEYQNGTPPMNFRPNAPEIVSPANNTSDISLTPLLVSNDFLDKNEEDKHLGTDWELFEDINFKNKIFSIHTDTDQLSIPLPEFVLESNKNYFWRIRHYDTYAECSSWTVGQFQTVEQSNFEDGIPIGQKVDDTADVDNDGTLDHLQSSIKSLVSVVGDVQVGIKSESPNDYTVSMVRSIDPDQEISDTINRPADLPYGLLSFKLNVEIPGNSAKISVHYSDPLPDNARWYMYDHQNGWTSYIPQLSIDRKTVTIYLTDGGDGDADRVKNGVIIDPSGPGIPALPDTPNTPYLDESIDNGSCFINSLLKS